MPDIKHIFEKLKNTQVTSEQDFFAYLRLYFCDHIKDKVEALTQSDKELAVGYRDASTINRLGIIGADTPKDFIKSITSVVSAEFVVEQLGEAQNNYKNFILRRGDDFIRTEGLDAIDQATKDQILRIYWECADLVTERVLADHSELPGLIDNTYNLSTFRLRDLDSVIDKYQSSLKQLEFKILEAHSKSYFDEEDQLLSVCSQTRNRLQQVEDIKIRSFRYNDQVADDDIDNIVIIKLREKYCHVMKRDAEDISSKNEAKKWSDRKTRAKLRQEYLISGKRSDVEKLDLAVAASKGEEMSFELDMQEERDSW